MVHLFGELASLVPGLYTADGNYILLGDGMGKMYTADGTLVTELDPGFDTASGYWKVAYITSDNSKVVLAARDMAPGGVGIAFFNKTSKIVPVASFSYSPEKTVVDQMITFDASASYDPDGNITNYEWSFGDGNITNTTEETILHSYSSEGNYTVNLTVTDDGGLTNSTSKTITVNPVAPTVVFDTGPGTYPSIAGTHNGIITPKQDIIVQKMYTYPCEGTGGHSKYARIWNASWEGVEAYWSGYKDDWHNITFDEPFTLFAEKTYYYEIRTGSYPQIHHVNEREAEGGMGIINCTSFVDANDKVYNDWIPAISLWS